MGEIIYEKLSNFIYVVTWISRGKELHPFPSLYSTFLHFFIYQPSIDSLSTLPSFYNLLLLPFPVPSVVPYNSLSLPTFPVPTFPLPYLSPSLFSTVTLPLFFYFFSSFYFPPTFFRFFLLTFLFPFPLSVQNFLLKLFFSVDFCRGAIEGNGQNLSLPKMNNHKFLNLCESDITLFK